jgi:hypothetical protein
VRTMPATVRSGTQRRHDEVCPGRNMTRWGGGGGRKEESRRRCVASSGAHLQVAARVSSWRLGFQEGGKEGCDTVLD